ncbi:hypothetical protein F5Y16DRAFT_370949 [Xylariaceae sp. FL0255]|nr:hypothetical protein F5Y16DRAFT_370949 [Xylariaceae sp. FL0255]
MHSGAITPLATFVAAAAATSSSRLYTRSANTTATTLTAQFEQWNTDGGGGAQFSVSAPAGYVPGALGFDVICDAGLATTADCTWQTDKPSYFPDYTTVTSGLDPSTLIVTLQNQFVNPNGLRTVRTAAGKIPADQLNDTPTSWNFTLTVSDDIETIPGVIGNYGSWSAFNATNPQLSEGAPFQPLLNYTLTAPDGYALDAPGFTVACSYNVTEHQDTTYYQTCTPVGDIAPGSNVTALAYYEDDYDIRVRHVFTAANGSAYEIDGEAEVSFYESNSFSISPHILLDT